MGLDKKEVKGRLVLTARAFLNGLLAILFFGLALFLPANTLKFLDGWIFLAVFIISMVLMLIYFSWTDPEYAKKRFAATEQETPQRIVMSLLVLSTLVMLALSGFNYRYQWSVIPIQLVMASALVMACAFVFLFIVMRENSYASRVVEIQKDQKLVDIGTYSLVRHPMYLAFSIIFCISPLVLGSLYSLIPAFCIPVLLTFRIRNEEKVLRNGLPGYESYMQKVKYRLVPLIW
jgi:protein-S-isoprenylcysteine O-methyltransferase Ste14